MEAWINEYFREQWEEVTTEIDFTKLTPFKTSDSLHIFEERYEVEGEKYRLLYEISDKSWTPLIQKLKK